MINESLMEMLSKVQTVWVSIRNKHNRENRKEKSFSNSGFEKHLGDPMCLDSDIYPLEFKD